jgi:acyl carrier protein phosphodiesterase
MNFLAHCLIGAQATSQLPAGRATAIDPDLVAGGFLGDFIKGRVPESMPAGLARGVRLHRRVDAYSNQQPSIRRSCDRFPAQLRRLAPVFVDIIADHLLSRNWSSYHDLPITAFTADTYELIAGYDDWLSGSARRFFTYMRDTDLLAAYADWDVTLRALYSITRRLNQETLNGQLESAVSAIIDDLAGDFSEYFPDIVDHAQRWLVDSASPRPQL